MTDAPASFEKVFEAPDLLLRTEHSLCPGCGEPVALRTILELIRDLGLRERTICVAGIGCSTAFPMIMDVDGMQTLPGPRPPVASGAKGVPPHPSASPFPAAGTLCSEAVHAAVP